MFVKAPSRVGCLNVGGVSSASSLLNGGGLETRGKTSPTSQEQMYLPKRNPSSL